MNNEQALQIICSNDERRAMFADMLKCFKAFDLRVVGSWGDSLLVKRKTFPYSKVFTVCDNGGEVNVEQVNVDDDSMRSVPYTQNTAAIDGATLAYRVRCVVDGDPIRYDISHRDDLDILSAFGSE